MVDSVPAGFLSIVVIILGENPPQRLAHPNAVRVPKVAAIMELAQPAETVRTLVKSCSNAFRTLAIRIARWRVGKSDTTGRHAMLPVGCADHPCEQAQEDPIPTRPEMANPLARPFDAGNHGNVRRAGRREQHHPIHDRRAAGGQFIKNLQRHRRAPRIADEVNGRVRMSVMKLSNSRGNPRGRLALQDRIAHMSGEAPDASGRPIDDCHSPIKTRIRQAEDHELLKETRPLDACQNEQKALGFSPRIVKSASAQVDPVPEREEWQQEQRSEAVCQAAK